MGHPFSNSAGGNSILPSELTRGTSTNWKKKERKSGNRVDFQIGCEPTDEFSKVSDTPFFDHDTLVLLKVLFILFI